MCDGFGGGMTRQRVLEIMKDSRIGAYGAIGIVCMLGLKCSTLAMLDPILAVSALLLGHPLSRLMATSLIWRMRYAREEGKAKPLAQSMRHSEFALACVTALLPALLMIAAGWLTWTALAYSLVAALLATLWLTRKIQQRLDGYTGDCLGAVQQLSEVAIYLALLAAARRHCISDSMRLLLVRHPQPLIEQGVCYGSSDLAVSAEQLAQTTSALTASLAVALPHGMALYTSPCNAVPNWRSIWPQHWTSRLQYPMHVWQNPLRPLGTATLGRHRP
jgi:hypothetical protein